MKYFLLCSPFIPFCYYWHLFESQNFSKKAVITQANWCNWYVVEKEKFNSENKANCQFPLQCLFGVYALILKYFSIHISLTRYWGVLKIG